VDAPMLIETNSLKIDNKCNKKGVTLLTDKTLGDVRQSVCLFNVESEKVYFERVSGRHHVSQQ